MTVAPGQCGEGLRYQLPQQTLRCAGTSMAEGLQVLTRPVRHRAQLDPRLDKRSELSRQLDRPVV